MRTLTHKKDINETLVTATSHNCPIGPAVVPFFFYNSHVRIYLQISVYSFSLILRLIIFNEIKVYFWIALRGGHDK